MDNAQSLDELLKQLENLDTSTLETTAAQTPDLYSSMFGFGMFSALMSAWWSWVICIITLVASWFIFQKAGKPGWAAIIPLYNVWVALEIIGKPWWWIILLLIPFVNIVVGIIMSYHLAKVFGQSVAFTVGLVLLPFIFMPMLAWGKYDYTKPKV